MSEQISADEAVARLEDISGDDPEAAHIEAEEVLLMLAPTEVREAFRRVVDRQRWWAYA